MNYTLVGASSLDFHEILTILGHKRWYSCFCEKHGFWAISLQDDVPVPDILRERLARNAIEVVPHGEMDFHYEDMRRLVPWLPED